MSSFIKLLSIFLLSMSCSLDYSTFESTNLVDNLKSKKSKKSNKLKLKDDDCMPDGDFVGNFTPPPKPESINKLYSATKKNFTEPLTQQKKKEEVQKPFSSLADDGWKENYYQQFIPSLDLDKKSKKLSDEDLSKKINYMIHLLEESQDVKQNCMTEELVLYCFLGVFIIFLVDSFAKVGKYVR